MTRHPIGLPDEPRPSIPDAYRVYPVERPTEGDTFWQMAVVIAVVGLALVALAGWALS